MWKFLTNKSDKKNEENEKKNWKLNELLVDSIPLQISSTKKQITK